MKTVVLTPSTHDLPPGWSGSALREVAQRAANRWSYPNVSCAVKVVVAEPAPIGRAAQDGQNLLVFRSHDWCHNDRCGAASTYPQRATGMTTTYPQGAMGRAVAEADVELNAVHFRLTAPEVPDPATAGGKWDAPLESVLVHEIGHVLGLGDACLAGHRASGRPMIADCDPEEASRAMFPTGPRHPVRSRRRRAVPALPGGDASLHAAVGHRTPRVGRLGRYDGRHGPPQAAASQGRTRLRADVKRFLNDSGSQSPGLNRGPTVYETVALPLSYSGEPL